MNEKKQEDAVKTLFKFKQGKAVENVLSDAEEAWKFNREAIRLIDLKNDEVQGEDRLEKLVDALGFWKISLEVLLDGSQKVAKRAHQALHSRGGHKTPEGHGEEYSPDDPSGEGNARTGATASKERPFRRRD